jgi:hypothetical protein
MKMKVIFENSPNDLESDQYLAEQPDWQLHQLENFVNELLSFQKIDHSDARKLSHNRWSLWVRREGEDAINHICYLARAADPILSHFERELMDPNLNIKPKAISVQRSLMIVNEDKSAVSIGRAEEYLDPQYYASLMDSIKKEFFLKTIEDIFRGHDSEDYTLMGDEMIHIHINRPHVAYGVHIECFAKWIKSKGR